MDLSESLYFSVLSCEDLPGALVVKSLPASAGGAGLIPGGGNGDPLQYSCMENPMDWGAWWATVHGVTRKQQR